MKIYTVGDRLCASFVMLWFSFITNAGAEAIDWPQLNFIEVATGVSAPTSIAAAPDGSGRLFVTEQNGRVMLIQSNSATPFLDIEDHVEFAFGTDKGLLSVAFPPGFATKQHFYAFYDAWPDRATTISRFRVSSTNVNVADPSSEERLLVIPREPQDWHLLSIGAGDSGGQRLLRRRL